MQGFVGRIRFHLQKKYLFYCVHCMTSFDIEPLFTNIPLDETINICADKLFKNKTKVNSLTKESF